jgi:hypothetical protein
MPKTDGGTDSRFQIGRRDFLVLSSTAVIGVAASGFGSEVARAAGFTAPRPFSVGFSDGGRMISADQLHHDFDADLARITVKGFWSSDDTPRSTAVAAYFRHAGHDMPFLAWGHVHRANALAPQGTFRVPVRNGALDLGFESRDPLPVAKSELTRRLSDIRTHVAGSQADLLVVAAKDREAAARQMLKARRGTYVVAFRDRVSDSKPNWRSLELAAGDKPLGNAKFDYLVFTVDHV